MAKKAAALSALNEWIISPKSSSVKTVGIGSGSTIVPFVQALGSYVAENKIDIKCIPTSYQAQELIIQNKLSMATLDEFPSLDLSFDGADEVLESDLSAIKGGGGCLLREKVVNFAAKKFIILCDNSKVSDQFGQNWKKGLPIEVFPIALNVVTKSIESLLGGKIVPRQCIGKLGPVVSDNGNFLVDWKFDDITLTHSWREIDQILHSIPGVIETGLFLNMATEVHVGNEDSPVRVLRK